MFLFLSIGLTPFSMSPVHSSSLMTFQVKLVPVSLPQSARKTSAESLKENAPLQPELNGTTRPTRSQLWDHPEEDLPLLDSPLEVDSETPVADALIRRLRDEEEKQEGEYR